MALLLGSTSEACASLRESIKENGGIIHPIIVNKRANGTYVVIEGNTRLQIYKDFIASGEPGNWTTIRAVVYENLEEEKMHATIRSTTSRSSNSIILTAHFPPLAGLPKLASWAVSMTKASKASECEKATS
jgi:hypothetical protein